MPSPASAATRRQVPSQLTVHKAMSHDAPKKAMDRAKGLGYAPSQRHEDAWFELCSRWDPEGEDATHRAFQRQWWQALAFYAGMQWGEWDETTGLFERKVKDPPWRIRYIANRILPMVMRAHSTMCAEQAVLRASPMNVESESRNAALLADNVYEWLIEHTGYDERREEALLWASTVGTGLVKHVWNPEAGEKKEVLRANGTRAILPIGDIELDSVSPFSIRVPGNVSEWRHMPWVVQVSMRPYEYLWERWPNEARFISPSSEPNASTEMLSKLSRLVGKLGFGGSMAGEAYENQVRIVELWTKPFARFYDHGKRKVEYPKGLHIIACNGVILKEGENEYHDIDMHLPYTPFFYGKVPGRFWGMGLAEALVDGQREYNTVRSHIIEHQRLMSKGKWLLPRGHGLPKEAITSEPGEVLEYNPALPKPEMVTPPPLPAYVMEHALACIQEMQDIAAQQDVTEAKAPASVRSGVAISLLQEKDTLVIAIPKRRLWRADKRVGESLLKMAQQLITEERTIQVVGPGRSFELKDFRGADLKGHTSLRIFTESGVLDSKAARQQNIMDLIQIGLLNPMDPQHRAAIMRMLELGDVKDYVYESTLDEKNAHAENDAMLKEAIAVPPVRFWEDHEVHIRVHKRMMKGPLFRAADPTIQEAIEGHLLQHYQMLAQQMLAEQQAVEATKGAPGEKGEASQPGAGTSGGSKKPGGSDGKKPGSGSGSGSGSGGGGRSSGGSGGAGGGGQPGG